MWHIPSIIRAFLYDRYTYYFFQLTNQIINSKRKAKTSKTNYLAHTRQNVESFLSQMQYITWLNLKQSWKYQCVCVSHLQYTWYSIRREGWQCNLLCLSTLHLNEQQSLHHLPTSLCRHREQTDGRPCTCTASATHYMTI